MTNPIFCFFLEDRFLALILGLYPKASAASRIRCFVTGLISEYPLNARDTVLTDTPASLPTSLMLTATSHHLLFCQFPTNQTRYKNVFVVLMTILYHKNLKK